MTADAEKLLKEALKLAPEARAALAAALLESPEGEADEAAEAAWATEIAKRVPGTGFWCGRADPVA